ncbi:MAG: fumarylacetoacetate hydrolase family protein [Pseudolabrys sp.]|nr:fumarylacetoacetate hydrolase family protein [Pseudolabrys sp.]MCW5696124.1 fumarylacetoacetate hydrolase family protein [Bauldia sp.]
MKLASYLVAGRPSFGIVTGEGVIDVPRRLPEIPDLKSALAMIGGLDWLRGIEHETPDLQPDALRFLPPIVHPDKVLCIGLNYREHAAEVAKALPPHPTVFVRFADAQTGHGEPMIRPKVSTRYDYEGELAVVIGRDARHVKAGDALSYVAGYTCFNDGSVRDWQGHTTQFTAGKNFYRSGAMGPFLVTADEAPDPSTLTVVTRLNGTVVQDGQTSDMIFDVPALIAYVSTFTPLSAGDVIATGTPSGVGQARKPPLYMKGGDVVEVEIEGIGLLRNPIADEA